VTNYNNMTVPELMDLAFGSHYRYADCQLGYDDWCDAITSALRKAVIREANGIAFHIENHETARNEYGVWTEKRVNGHVEPRGSSFQMIPPGDYVLISKVTP
jgi:hypothetical protein